MKRFAFGVGWTFLTLLALADRTLTVRDIWLMLKNLSRVELVFLIIGLIPIVLIGAWVLGALSDPPDDDS
jgi:hypothetical protein